MTTLDARRRYRCEILFLVILILGRHYAELRADQDGGGKVKVDGKERPRGLMVD